MENSLVCSASQFVFNFNAEHNGISCIQRIDAERPCDKIWFTVKQIEVWSGMSNRTLYNRINELAECERISRLQDFSNVSIPTETGAVKTTIYNLNVLANRLETPKLIKQLQQFHGFLTTSIYRTVDLNSL